MNIEVLKTAKERLGISYDEIARRSGVPKATVTNVMCGYTKRPRIDTISKIQAALEIDSGITPEEYAAGARMTAMRQVTADEDIVLDKYQEIKELLGKEKGQAYVESLLDSIIENFRK